MYEARNLHFFLKPFMPIGPSEGLNISYASFLLKYILTNTVLGGEILIGAQPTTFLHIAC